MRSKNENIRPKGETNMKKRCLSFFLILALLLTACGLAYAETWTCTECGTENNGNFCSECGAKKPGDEWVCSECGTTNSGGKYCSDCGAARSGGASSAPSSSTISDVRVSDDRDGVTRITWSDTTGGPYKVSYEAEDWDHFSIYDDGIRNTSHTTYCLVPGVKYTVTVSNGSSSASAEYTPSKTSFTDFKSGRRLKLDKAEFDARGDGYYTTFRLSLYYPTLSKDREYVYLLALKSPLGYVDYTRTSDKYVLERKYSGYYEDLSLSDFLDAAKRDYGSVPTGDYTLEVYFDGALYSSVSFYVRAD